MTKSINNIVPDDALGLILNYAGSWDLTLPTVCKKWERIYSEFLLDEQWVQLKNKRSSELLYKIHKIEKDFPNAKAKNRFQKLAVKLGIVSPNTKNATLNIVYHVFMRFRPKGVEIPAHQGRVFILLNRQSRINDENQNLILARLNSVWNGIPQPLTNILELRNLRGVNLPLSGLGLTELPIGVAKANFQILGINDNNLRHLPIEIMDNPALKKIYIDSYLYNESSALRNYVELQIKLNRCKKQDFSGTPQPVAENVFHRVDPVFNGIILSSVGRSPSIFYDLFHAPQSPMGKLYDAILLNNCELIDSLFQSLYHEDQELIFEQLAQLKNIPRSHLHWSACFLTNFNFFTISLSDLCIAIDRVVAFKYNNLNEEEKEEVREIMIDLIENLPSPDPFFENGHLHSQLIIGNTARLADALFLL